MRKAYATHSMVTEFKIISSNPGFRGMGASKVCGVGFLGFKFHCLA